MEMKIIDIELLKSKSLEEGISLLHEAGYKEAEGSTDFNGSYERHGIYYIAEAWDIWDYETNEQLDMIEYAWICDADTSDYDEDDEPYTGEGFKNGYRILEVKGWSRLEFIG